MKFETSTLSTDNVDVSEHVADSSQQANYCLKIDEILRAIEVCWSGLWWFSFFLSCSFNSFCS